MLILGLCPRSFVVSFTSNGRCLFYLKCLYFSNLNTRLISVPTTSTKAEVSSKLRPESLRSTPLSA